MRVRVRVELGRKGCILYCESVCLWGYYDCSINSSVSFYCFIVLMLSSVLALVILISTSSRIMASTLFVHSLIFPLSTLTAITLHSSMYRSVSSPTTSRQQTFLYLLGMFYLSFSHCLSNLLDVHHNKLNEGSNSDHY